MQEGLNQFKAKIQNERADKKFQLMQLYDAEIGRGVKAQVLEIKFYRGVVGKEISNEAAAKIKALFNDISLDSRAKFQQMVSLAISDGVFDRAAIEVGKIPTAVMDIFKNPQTF